MAVTNIGGFVGLAISPTCLEFVAGNNAGLGGSDGVAGSSFVDMALRPNIASVVGGGEGGGSDRIAAVPAPVASEVQSFVRQTLVALLQRGVFRDSPTSAQLNVVSATLTIDMATGTVAVEDKLHGRAPYRSVHLSVQGDADRNCIRLDEGGRSDIACLLEQEILPRVRLTLESISALDGQPLDPVESASRNGVALPEGDVVLQPAIEAEQLARMRSRLTIRDNRSLKATFGGSYFLSRITGSMDVASGAITLDNDGNITATEWARPDYLSPRGTSYRGGIVSGGARVPVIINPDGVLLYYELPDELNSRQRAAIMAYANSPENRTARDRIMGESPYLVDSVLNRPFGRMIFEIDRVGQFPGSMLAVLPQAGGYRFVPVDTAGDPPSDSVAVIRINRIVYRMEHLARDLGLSLGSVASKETSRFDYEVTNGELPSEVVRFMEWIRLVVEGRR